MWPTTILKAKSQQNDVHRARTFGFLTFLFRNYSSRRSRTVSADTQHAATWRMRLVEGHTETAIWGRDTSGPYSIPRNQPLLGFFSHLNFYLTLYNQLFHIMQKAVTFGCRHYRKREVKVLLPAQSYFLAMIQWGVFIPWNLLLSPALTL